MAKCNYCGSTILMGGVTAGQQRFCNNKCHQNAYILSVSQTIPADVVEKRVEEVWRGNCPKCNGLGMIVVRYYSDEPFDIAICDCKHGGHFRDDGGEAFIRDRLCLGPKNRVALLEDFGDQP